MNTRYGAYALIRDPASGQHVLQPQNAAATAPYLGTRPGSSVSMAAGGSVGRDDVLVLHEVANGCPQRHIVVTINPATVGHAEIGDCRTPLSIDYSDTAMTARADDGRLWTYANGKIVLTSPASPRGDSATPRRNNSRQARTSSGAVSGSPARAAGDSAEPPRRQGPSRVGGGLQTVPETEAPSVVPKIEM